ncbi:STAS domain-containing protein [Nonomuraea gerenzanensis]|uniref:Anti-sigma factor antagonist n=1 Tax=Nonomuraea gerenzanensis TaxID=93944 RepID=A0A1M4E5D2_9ACTN|nr:STAS domain-containing protein [Nonomuraea gerenzanensis]UBU16159.1 STAS domain-containing protein [Nonomuraea gerenzanensis]SBO93968.1 Anti-sigma F factor antagonist (spoIIAA-2); Anti-sigma B factor antagonist RsbV [Nonomuraea gerenzanensis]
MRSADRTGFSWVVTQGDDSAVLRLAGELDLASKEEFRNGLAEAMSCLRPPSVIVDLQDVAFCDSSGLNTLIWAANAAEAVGGSVRLSGAQPRVARLLRMTGLDKRFCLTPAGS